MEIVHRFVPGVGTTHVLSDGSAIDLSGLAAALDTTSSEATAKSRTFTAEPTTPYSVNDMWLASTGKVNRCIVARDTGAYVAADWSVWALTADYVEAFIELTSPTIVGGSIKTASTGIRWEMGSLWGGAIITGVAADGTAVGDLRVVDGGAPGTQSIALVMVGTNPFDISADVTLNGLLDVVGNITAAGNVSALSSGATQGLVKVYDKRTTVGEAHIYYDYPTNQLRAQASKAGSAARVLCDFGA